MQAALIVPRVTADLAANLARLERRIAGAAAAGAGLILLPEAALTGLVNQDEPAADLPLGQPIPGPASRRLGRLTRKLGVWLGFGLLETEGSCLYDSALLLGPDGGVHLKYRRIDPHWRGPEADERVYREGEALELAATPFGGLGFLLCGDLFNDEVLARFRALRADLLLLPLARSFPDGTADQVRWDRDELPAYAARARAAGAPALIVNYLASNDLEDDGSFGGALAVSAAGQVLASHPLGIEGTLLVDLPLAPDAR